MTPFTVEVAPEGRQVTKTCSAATKRKKNGNKKRNENIHNDKQQRELCPSALALGVLQA